MCRPIKRLFPALFLAWLLQGTMTPLFGDVVTLKDGRWLEGRIEEAGGTVMVHLASGTVKIPSSLVANVLTAEKGKLSSRQRKERQRIEKAVEEMKKHSAWKNRYHEKTRHFEFNYNVPPPIAHMYMDTLEGLYNDFRKQMGVRLQPGLKRKKMEINIFRDEENFLQIGGVPKGVLGFWNFVDERLFFYHDRNDPEFTLSVLLHEFTHLLTHLIKPRFQHPIWCNEGMSEYFGGSRREGTKLVFGGLQEGRIVALQEWRKEGKDYTIDSLLRCTQGNFGSIEYAWAWSLVHFLMETPKYRKKFLRYYRGLALDSGVQRRDDRSFYPTVEPGEDMAYFKKCLGLRSLDKLNEEWHAYIDDRLDVVSAKGYLQQAKVLFWKGENEEALAALKKAEEKWEGKPTSLLYHYKGLLLKRKGKYGEAVQAFQKAIELDPLSARDYYELGDALEEMDDETVMDDAMRNKRLARELAPDDYNLRYAVERDELKWKKARRSGEEAGKPGGKGR